MYTNIVKKFIVYYMYNIILHGRVKCCLHAYK